MIYEFILSIIYTFFGPWRVLAWAMLGQLLYEIYGDKARIKWDQRFPNKSKEHLKAKIDSLERTLERTIRTKDKQINAAKFKIIELKGIIKSIPTK